VANELILLVEDNPKNLKLVRDTLQVKGYQTIEAETGEEGVPLNPATACGGRGAQTRSGAYIEESATVQHDASASSPGGIDIALACTKASISPSFPATT